MQRFKPRRLLDFLADWQKDYFSQGLDSQLYETWGKRKSIEVKLARKIVDDYMLPLLRAIKARSQGAGYDSPVMEDFKAGLGYDNNQIRAAWTAFGHYLLDRNKSGDGPENREVPEITTEKLLAHLNEMGQRNRWPDSKRLPWPEFDAGEQYRGLGDISKETDRMIGQFEKISNWDPEEEKLKPEDRKDFREVVDSEAIDDLFYFAQVLSYFMKRQIKIPEYGPELTVMALNGIESDEEKGREAINYGSGLLALMQQIDGVKEKTINHHGREFHIRYVREGNKFLNRFLGMPRIDGSGKVCEVAREMQKTLEKHLLGEEVSLGRVKDFFRGFDSYLKEKMYE